MRIRAGLVMAALSAVITSSVFGSSWAVAGAGGAATSASQSVTSGTWGAAISTSATSPPLGGALTMPVGLIGTGELIYVWNTGTLPFQSVTYTFTSSSALEVATASSCSSLFNLLLLCLGGVTTIATSGTVAVTSTLVPPVGGSQQLLVTVLGPILGPVVGSTITMSVSVSSSQLRASTTTNS